MDTATTRRHAKVVQALEETRGRSAAVQAEAIDRVYMTEPSQPAADAMWIVLVAGLLVLIGGALAGLIFAHKDETMLTVVTTLSAGLLGLFAKSPVRG